MATELKMIEKFNPPNNKGIGWRKMISHGEALRRSAAK